ncbi:aminoglycoside phosphotransferase family protein [Nocardiopsis sp. MG754419]|uniref:aminoglycoside phosphotransferase family protein n=1 Tax=Nocardiopsis sp. MG754419 TaxID=2259865 RepID=UPI001BA83838|nr:aminoglycoside phosphotransferase family protein [Nocardiopsis sp. MG754419]MBR8741971.1 hydroxyurea phosphotransferase [Nocardiopsis sp. MG754419]
MDPHTPQRVDVPPALVRTVTGFFGPAWARGLPGLTARALDRWGLTVDGASMHGAVALVVPVRRPGGGRAVLKIQPQDTETEGEPGALRTWDGDGAVRLLEHDPSDGAMLLEALDPGRRLDSVPLEPALEVIGALLARLTSYPGPAGMRGLGPLTRDVAARGRDRLPRVGAAWRPVFERWTAAAEALSDEPGDRLLHWDLHYENVLAPREGSDRGPWLAIDPKPLVGDPGFELLPALRNRWAEAEDTGTPVRATRRRFDLLTEVAGLDRERARAWTRVRLLEDCLGRPEARARVPRAHALIDRALAERAHPD